MLLASGVVQGLVEVRTVADLFDTAYGRAVLAKVVLFAGIVALGWINRRRLLPALDDAARDARRSRAAPACCCAAPCAPSSSLGIAALAVTGALAGYPPSIAVSSGPYSTTANIGPARLEMTVDPARVGPNEIHVYLFDRRSGGQYDATKELTVTAELPEKRIAPIDLESTKAGPGHYVISGAALSVAGDWSIEVAARVSEFDEHRARIEVPIR